MLRTTIAAPLLLASGVLLAACGPSESTRGTTGIITPIPATPTAASAAPSDASTTASLTREEPGVLSYANPREPEKACPPPQWPAAAPAISPPGQGQRVLILGDSLTKYAHTPLRRELTQEGWLPTIVCWGGTQTDWALSEARHLARERYVPSRVVIAMGANDVHKNPCTDEVSCAEQVKAFGQRAEALLDYLGPQRQVWWLTIDMDAERASKTLGEPWNRNYPAFNEQLAAVLRKYPNATLIPWHQIVVQNRSTLDIEYSWDGLHYDPVELPYQSAGTMLRVRTIADALRQSASANP